METAKPVDFQVGTWVNVVGYVTKIRSRNDESQRVNDENLKVHIQAIMLWSAGSIKVDEYEKALEARKSADNL